MSSVPPTRCSARHSAPRVMAVACPRLYNAYAAPFFYSQAALCPSYTPSGPFPLISPLPPISLSPLISAPVPAPRSSPPPPPRSGCLFPPPHPPALPPHPPLRLHHSEPAAAIVAPGNRTARLLQRPPYRLHLGGRSLRGLPDLHARQRQPPQPPRPARLQPAPLHAAQHRRRGAGRRRRLRTHAVHWWRPARRRPAGLGLLAPPPPAGGRVPPPQPHQPLTLVALVPSNSSSSGGGGDGFTTTVLLGHGDAACLDGVWAQQRVLLKANAGATGERRIVFG